MSGRVNETIGLDYVDTHLTVEVVDALNQSPLEGIGVSVGDPALREDIQHWGDSTGVTSLPGDVVNLQYFKFHHLVIASPKVAKYYTTGSTIV